MVSPRALKLLPYLVVITAIIGGYFYVTSLQETVAKQEATLREKEEEVNTLRQQVQDLSTQRSTIETALAQAEVERNRIRADLSKALTRLRTQQPPVECKAAVEWAVDNKEDLAW